MGGEQARGVLGTCGPAAMTILRHSRRAPLSVEIGAEGVCAQVASASTVRIHRWQHVPAQFRARLRASIRVKVRVGVRVEISELQGGLSPSQGEGHAVVGRASSPRELLEQPAREAIDLTARVQPEQAREQSFREEARLGVGGLWLPPL